MNNSVAALCRALSASLRDDVMPKVDDAFARGQLAAAMYVLNNLERQAAWSPTVLSRHIAQAETAITETRTAISALGLLPPPSLPVIRDAELQIHRDAANTEICELFDWFADKATTGASTPALREIEKDLLERIAQTVLEEKRLVPPSMMREMSGG